jgi:hypothetical protein
MNTGSKVAIISALGILAVQEASAATPTAIDTLTCIRSVDGSTLKHSIYAFSVNTGKSNPRYFTAYFSDSELFTYTFEEIFGSGFKYCTFGKLPGTVLSNVTAIDVNTAGVGANVGALSVQENSVSQGYTEVTFQYTFLEISSTSMPAATASAEDQAKALAAFQAKGLAMPK